MPAEGRPRSTQNGGASFEAPLRGAPQDEERREFATRSQATGAFDIRAIAVAFPDEAATLLLDTRLTDREAASARVFRVYRPTPPHYHVTCDEYLFCLSGRVTFRAGEEAPHEIGPGQLVFFARGTVHAMPAILEEPLVFLAIDTPRRDPRDIVFVDPADGTPDTFIRAIPPG